MYLFSFHPVIGDTGRILSVYRKIHLFDVDIENGDKLLESAHTIPGSEIVKPVSTPFGRIGLAICYDLRFPEHSCILQKEGMDILTYPSAFTVKTGVAHWEPLLRSRAIETQSYVVAAAQYGKHTSSRSTYGHAMVLKHLDLDC